jgi:glycosyltransferase involved in cell wall biosynthesis
VQMCTREYVELLRQAGFGLNFCLFDDDRRLSIRIRRNLFTSPFGATNPRLAQRVASFSARSLGGYIFLNQTALASLAPALKTLRPKCQIVVLSHGLESTDLVHSLRLRRHLPLTVHAMPAANLVLGDMLLKELEFRSSIDAVCTLSPFDADLERWLGAKSVFWIPRTIKPDPLDWKPHGRYFGFVGTLDHAPNLEGLVAILDALRLSKPVGIRIRVVGGPPRLGVWLAEKYQIVDYLGLLGDAELRDEAASWSAFVHPIFCLPRGCSTKLATALSWQIPIVTSEAGHRGYLWRRGRLNIANNSADFVQECIRLLDAGYRAQSRQGAVEVSCSSPSIEENTSMFREGLRLT